MLRKHTPPTVKSIRSSMALDPIFIGLPVRRSTIKELRARGLLSDEEAHDKNRIANAINRALGIYIKLTGEAL